MSPSWTKVRTTAVFIVPLALSAGCAAPTVYEYAEVEGKVTLDGKPLSGIMVTFYPVSDTIVQPPIARGTTDESGSFRLAIDEKQLGAVVGPSIAVVQWPVRDRAAPPPVPDVPIPVKYTVVTESPLKVDVRPGARQTINLTLQRD